MKRRPLLCLSALLISALPIGALVIASRDQTPTLNLATEPTYELSLSQGLSVEDGTAIVKNQRNTEFEFQLTDYTPGLANLGTLASGGEILNRSAFHSLRTIQIALTSGSVSLYNGWDEYGTIHYASSPVLTVTGTQTLSYDFSTIGSAFFKIAASENSVLQSVTITYACTPSVSVDHVRIHIDKPTIGSDINKTVSASNFVWINTNIKTEQGDPWESYLMTKDGDGGWYVDFEDIPVLNEGYKFNFYVCDSNSEISWSYGSNKNGWGFAVSEGQTEVNVSGVDFANQPTPVVSTYQLNLTINVTGSFANFGDIQLIYNYTNSTSNYQWNNKISETSQAQYSYQKSGLDAEQNLYFKVYVWAGKDIYIGDVDGANFVLTPSGRTEENVTITFTAADAASIVGTCEIETPEPDPTAMSFADQTTTIYPNEGPLEIIPTFDQGSDTFTCSYSGENIRIDDNRYIVGLKAGTTTKVTLTSTGGLSCNFNVTIPESNYEGTWTRDRCWCDNKQEVSIKEGWFSSTHVEEITGMGKDFMNGVDISNTYALYHNGTNFYNADGVEQSLFYIFKDAGVNWVRLRLWVDPESDNGISYGAGECNLQNVLWMANEVKKAGLNLFLDFHYSDYWTHPGQQILPKSWNDCNSKESLCERIRSYTADTLTTFEEHGCLPDMVQLGNEISSGIYLQQYTGGGETLSQYGEPSYLNNNSSYSYGTADKNAFADYIIAAARGVNDVDSSIKKVIHWAKGSQINYGVINSFFAQMPSEYYDYAAISFYPFYCFDTMDAAITILNGLNPGKPWFIAETSYPFSGESYVYENGTDVTAHTFSNGTSSGVTAIRNQYSLNAAGQANLIHDLTEAVVDAHGIGIFYWEAAWVPNVNVGWAGAGSACTWSNQGFFSHDGKAIANLDLFKQMSRHI